MRETHNERVRRYWREAEAEVSVIHPGNCATCGGAAVVIPHMEVSGPDGERRDVPLDKASPLYKGPGMIRGHLICPCCSFAGCRHKSARELQLDRDREIAESRYRDAMVEWARTKRKQLDANQSG